MMMPPTSNASPLDEKYEALGGPSGPLGAPTEEERPHRDGLMRRFENGCLYWSEATGAHALIGPTRDVYDELDRTEAHVMGFPMADEESGLQVPRLVRFQGG